jgi:sugar transferase (PEP-CTERM system associated)
MIRLFNVYYPVRTLVLVIGEALIIWTSLLLGTYLRFGEERYFFVLNFEHGYQIIIALTILVLLLSHWFDLYDPTHFDAKGELYFRLLMVPGLLAMALAFVGTLFPWLISGNSTGAFWPDEGAIRWGPYLLWGMVILTLAVMVWRNAYAWLAQQPYLRERVYVLGADERAQRLVRGLRSRSELGIDVVGWSGDLQGLGTRADMGSHLRRVAAEKAIHRVIVAMQDRRDVMPMTDLLDLRLRGGVHIEEATSWLEKISGKIEVEQLHPSWIIFANGFRFGDAFRLLRRLVNFTVGLISLVLAAPLIPFIILAIKLDSTGPAVYRQERVGRGGKVFRCYKFRSMRPDAEADKGPTWADDDDPRITNVGRFLRTSRLDEIPQLWCVLKGDMAFVGPRPERPEFVKWLTEEIPYYNVRHLVRPGITGWAQIKYKYGNTIEDAREKLQYDLFYIKNASIGLDVLIMFQTIKILLLRRGGQ